MTRTQILPTVLASLLATAIVPTVARQAAAEEGGAPSMTRARMMTTTATIKDIDKAHRTVTLEGERGRRFTVYAPQQVDIDKLKSGDRVEGQYYESVALSMARPKEGAPAMETRESFSQIGDTGMATRQVSATVEILGVNPSDNTVEFRGPYGVRKVTVEDPANQARLRQIAPGDKLELTWTEAVAVELKPLKSHKK